jgi:hypothetical protein
MVMHAIRHFSWFLVFPFGFVLPLSLGLLIGCQTESRPIERADSGDTMTLGTVQLQIDFAGKREPISLSVPCSANSTVLTSLQRAQDQGDLEFKSIGSGPAAFVVSIEGIKNADQQGRNWVFRINGIMANLGCGAFRVTPGDEIQWEFGEYLPE